MDPNRPSSTSNGGSGRRDGGPRPHCLRHTSGPRPQFKFNEAISFEVHCETQQEIDELWEKLSAGGDPKAQQCGWLKDRFGVSWQIIPSMMDQIFGEATSPKSERVMRAMLQMKKLDIATLKRAYEG